MRYFILLLLSSFAMFSCEKDTAQTVPMTGTHTFNFGLNKTSDLEVVLGYDLRQPGELFGLSNKITRVVATHKVTGEPVIGYVSSDLLSKGGQMGEKVGKIYDGYGFDGECFVWGTYIEANDGSSVFIEKPIGTYAGHDPVCPGYGEVYT